MLMEDVKRVDSPLTHIILLTHNTHFHHDVTYVRTEDERAGTTAGRRFFSIRKDGEDASVIERHGADNPVKTYYRMLWMEVARASDAQGALSPTLQNVLRRILESYFKAMGDVGIDDLNTHFTGLESVAFRALWSWANDGSHTIIDTPDFVHTQVAAATALSVFREIFVRTHHGAHYTMMMRASGREESTNI